MTLTKICALLPVLTGEFVCCQTRKLDTVLECWMMLTILLLPWKSLKRFQTLQPKRKCSLWTITHCSALMAKEYLNIILMHVANNKMSIQDWCEEIFRVPSPPDPETITYHSTMIPGMNCDFEPENGCDWNIVPAQNQRKSGETGLVRTRASENNYGRNKDGTYRKKNKGHYLIFQANYRESANMDCSPSYSHIESPWIEQSLPECVLQFNFTGETKEQSGCLWRRQSQLKCFYCSDSRGLPSYKRARILWGELI